MGTDGDPGRDTSPATAASDRAGADTAGPAGAPSSSSDRGYDVFLSHNGDDKAAVIEIANRLRATGLAPFLDVWHLVPGEPWQEALEAALDASRSCAVFLGPAGFGPWENEEMRAALSRRVADAEYRVIPVLLPGATLPERGRLPRFLSRVTWVDFRPGLDDPHAFDRLVSGIRGLAPDSGIDDVAVVPEDEIACPFRGLEVFDEAHAEFFFGREALTQHLAEQLRLDRFLCVIGPSGSGKSSVVRAGLVPALRGGALPGSGRWRIEVVRPGPHPMEALASGLVAVAGPSGDAIGTRASILDTLERDERGLHSIVQLAVDARSSDDRVVLVVDQFEEVFTLVQDDAERTRFIAALLYASSVVGGATVVVPTMRADFFGKCAAIQGLAARLSERDVLVPPMDHDELRRAITQPAERVGLQFEKGLVDTILADLGDEPGSLPLLQHTLFELFEGRRGRWLTIDRYREIGGVQGAIAQRAETVFGLLTAQQQVAARRILLRLTQPGEGTEDTRRRALVTELVPAGAGGAAVEAVVNELAAARLVTTSRDESGQEIVDVAHEALIRGWPRLQGWVDENPAALRIHRELTVAAEGWSRNRRERSYLFAGPRLDETSAFAARSPDELNELERTFLTASQRTRRRRAVQLVAAIVSASLVVAALGAYGIWKGSEANASEARAAQARDDAQRQLAGARAYALLTDGVAVAATDPSLALRLTTEALARAADVQIDTQPFQAVVAKLLASGVYAAVPSKVEVAWADPGGKIVVAGLESGPHIVSQPRSGTVLATLTSPASDVAFPSAGDADVLAIFTDAGIEIRRISDGSVVEMPGRVETIAISSAPDAETFLVGYGVSDGSISDPPEIFRSAEVRSVVDGHLVRTLSESATVDFLPHVGLARALLGEAGGAGIDLIDLADGRLVKHVNATGDDVTEDPSGRTLLVMDSLNLNTCDLWSLATGSVVVHKEECEETAFSPDGSLFAFVGRQENLVYRVATGKRLFRTPSDFGAVSFSPEPGARHLIVERESSTDLYSTTTGRRVASFPDRLVDGDPDTRVVYSPDGTMAFIRMTRSSELISTETGAILLHGDSASAGNGDIALPPEGVQAVTFSPNGDWLIADDTPMGLEFRRTDDLGTVVSMSRGALWPGTDPPLLISDRGLEQMDVPGLKLVVAVGQAYTATAVLAFSPGTTPAMAVIQMSNPTTSAPIGTAILTRDGTLRPLPAAATAAAFGPASAPPVAMITEIGGDMTLWDLAATPRTLTTFAGGAAHQVWDPQGHWLLATLPDGTSELVDLDWLRAMNGPTADSPPAELERMACSGPAPKLVDDATLAARLGEQPVSCRG